MALMAISAEQCQHLVNYVTADLIEKANICTERVEIDVLKIQAELMGLSINFDEIWEETKKTFINDYFDKKQEY
jgi:hypothetical protein